MSEFEPEQIAEFIASVVDTECVRDGNVLDLPEWSYRIEVGGVLEHDPTFVEVLIGVGDPAWGGYAWDRSVGVSRNGSHPIGESVLAWTHYVLPLFIAMRQPDHPLTGVVYREQVPGGEILAGPVVTRNFHDLPADFEDKVAANPPTMIVAEWLATGGQLPERPTWLYTTCSRVAETEAEEVAVNNSLVTEHFTGFADDLDWGDGSGTVKSWAILRALN
ncbi:hypothetical protein LWC34_24105 [Kibdelosporangium philippinense]|uniref:DUF3000 domain-containing protein n=1 Tax=Kibdelosporangium philippinense TaxID=211113 RepID=A0ABS8ZF34_9PSEU|nr:hypothetical protein [Kibdelosporangium philippinense]MCE7005889.1 hypothetical protein [Kibdelosporangium philippinense]